LVGEVGYDTSTMVLKTSHPSGRVEARLGGYLYRVWLPDEVPVPSWTAGSVELRPQLTVRKLSSAEHAPEPSTLALGAVAALGLAARRRRLA
jgi:MYXO-CTERM domain-containing protein